MNVLARIVYHLADNNSVRIDYGVWLDARIRFETLDVGDTRELVLFLQLDSDKPELDVLEDRRDLNSHFSEPWSWFRTEEIANLASVEVTLIETESQTKHVFPLEIRREGPIFRVVSG